MFSAPPTPSSTNSPLPTPTNYFSSITAENSAATENVGILPDCGNLGGVNNIANYYSPNSATNPYQFPFLLPGDWTFQFSTPDGSQIGPGLHSPLTNQFAQLPLTNSIYNPTNRTPFSDFYGGHSPMVQYSTNNHLKKSAAGRKPKDLSLEMEDEDEERRQKRRQRNKEAAARCRQRRIDQTSELINQVNQYKKDNESCQRIIEKLRLEIEHCQAFMQKHDCKLPQTERQLPNIPRPQNTYQPLQLLPMPPRSETAQSMTSQHSSSTSSSEQHSPVEEDYKPTIDQLKLLPPISSMQHGSLMRPPQIVVAPPPIQPPQQQQQQQPPPAPPQINAPSTSTSSSSAPISAPNDDGFREPERKIPRIDPDRTLTSVTTNSDDIERPNMLPTLSINRNGNAQLSTPSRMGPTPNSDGFSSLFGNDINDFLSTNTGLTPSGQPVLNFSTSQSPMDPNREADLRPL